MERQQNSLSAAALIAKMVSPEVVAAILRNDFSCFLERSFYELNPTRDFQDNWHLHVLAHRLEQLRLGAIKRLIVNIPPRSLKSHATQVAFVAWLLGHDPSAQIICASYAQDLSNKFASDCRNLMRGRMYRDVFRTRLSSERPALNELVTTRQGFRLATSVGGVLTGRGADYLIIDDPSKPEEANSDAERKRVNDWFDHTVLSRLNDKQEGRIVIIMQRLHEDDLTGHLMKQGGWELLRFPAIAEEDEIYSIPDGFGGNVTYSRRKGEALHPERESLETLEQLRSSMGSYYFAAQYQQSPAPLGGGIIKESWLKTCSQSARPDSFDYILQSWDTANKATEISDFSVCTTWGKKGKVLYLLHVQRKRLDYPSLKRTVVEQARLWGASTILIEDKASGTQLIQELLYEGVHGVRRYEPKPGFDKIQRMFACSNMLENGFVYLPEDAEWLAEYKHELLVFPNGKYDDQVDSTSQALDWMKQTYLQNNEVRISFVNI